MKNRFKQIRQHFSLSQEAFGKRLGVTGAAISRIESGNRDASGQIILAICREFNVSETWLRTGEGEMFLKMSKDEELSKFFGDVSFGKSDFKRRFISILAQLDESGWKLLEDMALKLAEKTEKDKKEVGP